MLKTRKKRGHYNHYSLDMKMAVVSEIEIDGVSIMEVSRKYTIAEGTIRNWLRKSASIEKKFITLRPESVAGATPSLPSVTDMAKKEDLLARMSESELRTEVLRLQKELKIMSLRAEALDVMIDLAERKEGIQIRKKSGAKQS